MKKRVSELESGITTLGSELSNLTDTVRKVSRRTALTDYREKQREEKMTDSSPPPKGDKAAAKRFYLHGKTHADVARQILSGGES